MPPIYDYKCNNCGKTQEHIVQISQIDGFKPDTGCCKKPDVARYMPSNGAPKMKKGYSWGGGKGNWSITMLAPMVGYHVDTIATLLTF